MVLEALAYALPWNWFDSHSTPAHAEKRKSRKKAVRTRADELASRKAENHGASHPRSLPSPYLLNFRVAELSEHLAADGGYYPGLVNISGTYCFMDSTLQAMASLTYLQPHIDAIHAKAVALDVPTPVVDALRALLHTLNTPSSAPSALRPIEMISALSASSSARHNSLFSSREHQDAQELFQLLSECIKNEAAAVDREGHRDRGLGALAHAEGPASREIGTSVFDGLTANRRSCMECGYTEAVMHFAFDNWQLAVPRLTSACRLEDCLEDYTRLEILTDCVCRKCSMLATYYRLQQEAEKLTEAADVHESSPSKKKRAREARKLLARVKAAIDQGRIEEDIKGVKMERVFSKASTKQAMIARPPRVLALHLNRSVHYGHYAGKNTCRVLFPEILDLTPYTTSGQLSTVPSVPISTPAPALPRSTTPTPASVSAPRTLYRLAAVVCHYGAHSFGHYVCFRRKPRRHATPPTLACPLSCECPRCARFGPVRDDADPDPDAARPGCGWLRVSDDSVRECGLESVLQEGAGVFMLYYERVVLPRGGPYMVRSPRSSEETLRPEGVRANGSWASLASEDGGVVLHTPVPKAVGPRIVRNVSAQVRGMSRSPSAREEGTPQPLPRMLNGKLHAGLNGDAVLPNGDAFLPPQDGDAALITQDGDAVPTPQDGDGILASQDRKYESEPEPEPNGVVEATIAAPAPSVEPKSEHEAAPATSPVRPSSSSKPASSPSPSPRLPRQPLPRASPQPQRIASPAGRPPSPTRMVGLRA
ncbi:hypothetical protein BKA93DRAFT_838915 [Sparassis latifolia]